LPTHSNILKQVAGISGRRRKVPEKRTGTRDRSKTPTGFLVSMPIDPGGWFMGLLHSRSTFLLLSRPIIPAATQATWIALSNRFCREFSS
jgi:hypothetical protein